MTNFTKMNDDIKPILYTNTTSAYIPKKLNKEKYIMENTTECDFYLDVLKYILTNYIKWLQEKNMIEFVGTERPTDEWSAELFLSKNDILMPYIDTLKKECILYNLKNKEHLITYKYNNNLFNKYDTMQKINKDIKDFYEQSSN